MLLSKSSEKKKLSIDFNITNYDIMQKFGHHHNLTNSATVNYLISLFLQLSPTIKKRFAQSTFKSIQDLKKAYISCQEYKKLEIEKEIETLTDLLMFFTDGKGYVEEEKESMIKVDIKHGYVIFPKNWIVIDLQNSCNCAYVGVIEMKNSDAYNAPHILFFSPIPIGEIDSNFKENLFVKCEKEYPDFRRIRAMQIEPVYGENNEILNGDLWMKAPIIGIFAIPTYGEDYEFPAGAMIVRTTK